MSIFEGLGAPFAGAASLVTVAFATTSAWLAGALPVYFALSSQKDIYANWNIGLYSWRAPGSVSLRTPGIREAA